jgi:hypothetical protein
MCSSTRHANFITVRRYPDAAMPIGQPANQAPSIRHHARRKLYAPRVVRRRRTDNTTSRCVACTTLSSSALVHGEPGTRRVDTNELEQQAQGPRPGGPMPPSHRPPSLPAFWYVRTAGTRFRYGGTAGRARHPGCAASRARVSHNLGPILICSPGGSGC